MRAWSSTPTSRGVADPRPLLFGKTRARERMIFNCGDRPVNVLAAYAGLLLRVRLIGVPQSETCRSGSGEAATRDGRGPCQEASTSSLTSHMSTEARVP